VSRLHDGRCQPGHWLLAAFFKPRPPPSRTAVVLNGFMLTAENEDATRWAEEAGQLLLDLRATSEPGKELGDAGDQLAHRHLMDRIADRYPADRIRSEEADQAQALGDQAGRVWIIDPLDGTREYSEGRDDWAVHVALAVDGLPAVGAVALPSQGKVLGSGNPPPLPVVAKVPRMVVSRSRPPDFVPFVADRVGATVVPMGSAGAKIAAVIQGDAEIYLHSGGQYEWDSAAPVAVALASGLVATRLDGSPLIYSQVDPWLPDLMVLHPSLSDVVTLALEEFRDH
jgi:3'(2'), 5'-bisphosphate nucleotidase